MHGENKLRSTGIICSGGHLISKWIRLARKILQNAEDMRPCSFSKETFLVVLILSYTLSSQGKYKNVKSQFGF